jgi:hypothetical protein
MWRNNYVLNIFSTFKVVHSFFILLFSHRRRRRHRHHRLSRRYKHTLHITRESKQSPLEVTWDIWNIVRHAAARKQEKLYMIWKNVVKLEIEEIVDCNPRHKLYWSNKNHFIDLLIHSTIVPTLKSHHELWLKIIEPFAINLQLFSHPWENEIFIYGYQLRESNYYPFFIDFLDKILYSSQFLWRKLFNQSFEEKKTLLESTQNSLSLTHHHQHVDEVLHVFIEKLFIFFILCQTTICLHCFIAIFACLMSRFAEQPES